MQWLKITFCDWRTTGIQKSKERLYDLRAMKQSKFEPKFYEYIKNYSKNFRKTCTMSKST